MSINTVDPQRSLLSSQQSPVDSKPSDQNPFWKARSVHSGFGGLSRNEWNRLSLRLFGVGSFGTGTTLLALVAVGSVTSPLAALMLPLFLSSAGAFWYSTQLDDYDNPEELERFRRDAEQMTGLDQIAQSYGWTNLFQWGILTPDQFAQKYRQQVQGKDLVAVINYYEKVTTLLAQVLYPRFPYYVPSPIESKRQWQKGTATQSFEQIIQTYPLDKLEKYQILERGELHRIKELKRDFDVIKKQYDDKAAGVEQQFQNDTSHFRFSYDAECARADQIYNSNEAVRELQDFEMRNIRERQPIHQQLCNRKKENKTHFDRSVSPFTQDGQIPYERLSPSDKLAYDRFHQEYQHADTLAESEASLQIRQLDARRHGDRVQFNSEESRVRAEQIQLKNEAKRRFCENVATLSQNKERSLTPLKTSFQSSTSDLNLCYRAYLRINSL